MLFPSSHAIREFVRVLPINNIPHLNWFSRLECGSYVPHISGTFGECFRSAKGKLDTAHRKTFAEVFDNVSAKFQVARKPRWCFCGTVNDLLNKREAEISEVRLRRHALAYGSVGVQGRRYIWNGIAFGRFRRFCDTMSKVHTALASLS